MFYASGLPFSICQIAGLWHYFAQQHTYIICNKTITKLWDKELKPEKITQKWQKKRLINGKSTALREGKTHFQPIDDKCSMHEEEIKSLKKILTYKGEEVLGNFKQMLSKKKIENRKDFASVFTIPDTFSFQHE